jgi:hypothetical protein
MLTVTVTRSCLPATEGMTTIAASAIPPSTGDSSIP